MKLKWIVFNSIEISALSKRNKTLFPKSPRITKTFNMEGIYFLNFCKNNKERIFGSKLFKTSRPEITVQWKISNLLLWEMHVIYHISDSPAHFKYILLEIMMYQFMMFLRKATLLLRQCVNKALMGSASQKATNPADGQRFGHKIP